MKNNHLERRCHEKCGFILRVLNILYYILYLFLLKRGIPDLTLYISNTNKDDFRILGASIADFLCSLKMNGTALFHFLPPYIYLSIVVRTVMAYEQWTLRAYALRQVIML
jgi:hypothetical protein